MDQLFDEMIGTLVEAQNAVREELEAQERRPIRDSSSLRQLSRSVRSFSRQTDSLLLLMVERGAPEPLLERVEDLFAFFRQAEDRIEGLLAEGRSRSSARGRA